MLVTFKYRLYPNKEQKRKINFTLERCRLLYNRLLEERILTYKEKKKGLSYFDQTKTFRERKKYIPALKEVHSQVLQDVARRLDRSFQAFFRRVKQGEKAGFPNYKVRHGYNSFTYPQSGYAIDGNRLNLSMIGSVKIKLHRPLRGKMKTCTIVNKNGKYYACISSEVENEKLNYSGRSVDVGPKFIDAHIVHVSEHLRKNEQRLDELKRSISLKKPGSNRRKKAVLSKNQINERLANQRIDWAHKLSRQLVDQCDHIHFNNSNCPLSGKKAESTWNELIQLTHYKAEMAGKVVIYTDSRKTLQK